MKMDRVALCVLQTLLVLVTLPPAASAPCPRPCSCPQPTELHCTFRSLITIPAAIPKHVQRMNLGFNSINEVTDKSLSGLRKLELLMVHGNDIHDLPDSVFRDLASLQMLKISYNKLREISRHTLHGLWSLARLHLDHNQLEFIHPDAFQGMTSLRLLQLEGNRLQQLHPSTFTTFSLMDYFHISTLRHLYLSDNGLTSLSPRLVTTMPELENLYLHGNPWTCDCNMKWLQGWEKSSPGVLKCKKDKALPGGQLCPICSSPKHLQGEVLHGNLICSTPVISSSHRTSQPDDVDSEVRAMEDFREPFGNISLHLSDEHGNEVDLECNIGEPGAPTKINWEKVNQFHLSSNLSLSMDIGCPVDREHYEKLWRLIAYYSNVPAHLQRGIMLTKDPHPTYVYKQDSEKDAQYYTGVKVNIMAQPPWLMQTSADLQLNTRKSSAKMAQLILSTDISETVEIELVQRQRRTWVMIESTNRTLKALTSILGSLSQMDCNVHSSGEPIIYWMLPDGSKVEASSSSPASRVSVSSEGRLVIKAVRHTDTGIYYCVAKIHGDLAFLPFHLTVQDSSSPSGEDTSIPNVEEFAGNPISLHCVASGSPDAEINWILPSSKIVSFQANSSRALVYSNGTLHISQTQLSDSGYYKCIAINQHGADTLVTKITIVRRKGLIRPLRKFPVRPQSASGVNTQIKVPTEDAKEASGDIDVTQEVTPIRRLDAPRRRIPGGVATGGRRVHPSRSIWRRPPVLRKTTGSHTEERKKIIDSRRKINMSKSKIDPEKWADILAKIRDRNVQNTVTPLTPVRRTTEKKVTEPTTQSQETVEGSSDGMTLQGRNGGQDYFNTPHTPVQRTEMEPNAYTTQDPGAHVTSNSYTAQTMHYMTNSQHTQRIHTTGQPHTIQTTYSVQQTNADTNLNLHTTSDGVAFLPLTTSVPLHTVTFWQANTNIASSSSSAFSLQEKHSTNTDVGVKTAEWSKASERSETMDVASSSNDGNLFLNGIIPSVNPNESGTSQDGKGKYLSETATTSQWQTKPTDIHVLHSKAMLTTATPTTMLVPTLSRRRGSVGQSLTQLRPINSRRKNGRRPNRRNKKLNKPTQFISATPAITPLATAPTTASKLKIEPLQTTGANFNTTSSGRLSNEESTVSGHYTEAVTKPSPPTKRKNSLLTFAKPLFKSTTVAPSFPTASPGVGHGKTSSQTALRISESVFPAIHVNNLTSTTLQTFTGSLLPPVEPLEETQRISIVGELGPVPHSDNSSGAFHPEAQTQTDVELNQFGRHYTPTESQTETRMHALLPSPMTSTASLIKQEFNKTSAYKSRGLIKTHSMELDTKQVDTPITSIEKIHPSATSSMLSAVIPSTMAPYVTRPEMSSSRAEIGPSPAAPIHNSLSDNHSEPITTSEPCTTSNFHIATQSSDHKVIQSMSTNPTSLALPLTSMQTTEQTATPAPTIASIQTDPFSAELPTRTPDVTRKDQLPGQGSVPRGGPSIAKSNFQTFTVKAETDVQLPCEAKGEPMPFLSWTKVASGVSIAQNTRIQRFEVHPNGTLIIRNTQPMDWGQYMCTVQNQYGTDKMMVNLVVRSQHPQILQPRQRDITVNLGGKVDLQCTVEGHPLPQVMWVLPNQARMSPVSRGITPQQRLSILSDGTLRIIRVTYTDEGTYKCIGSNSAGADTVSVTLSVSALPPVIQQAQSENITLPGGSATYIHCSAVGSPQPHIQWITPDGARHTAFQSVVRHNLVVFPNGTLYMQGLGPRNSGRYECVASNMVGSSRRTVILSTRRTPSAKANITLSSPQKTNVIYGGALLLNCVATGEPEPRIIWRTPYKKLVDAQYSFDPRINVFPNGSIIIHSVTDKDSGDYLCVARNKMGDDYVLLQVNVLNRPAKIKQKQQQSSQEVMYGGDLKVDCVASGLPNPEISWALPDGTMVNPVKHRDGVSGGSNRRYKLFDNGTLYFNEVGMPEEGDYTCYAENQLGKDEMKVRVKVKVSMSPPQIQDKGKNIVRVFYGETVTLECNTKGRSMAGITWISPTNRVISPTLDKYQVLDDGTLVVQRAQRFDGGNYTCMARNNAGQDHKIVRLEVMVNAPVINSNRTASTFKVTALPDQQKFIDCVAKGTPTPRIMWVLPGNVILPAPYYSKRITVHQNGTLEIRSPKRTDSGQLACIARNEGGEVRMLVNFDVREVVERPTFRAPNTDTISLTVGNSMTLNCSFEGSTLPHVTWILPNGTPLHSGAQSSKFYHRRDGSLIITNPSVAEAGMYRCLGRNFLGLVERVITLSPGKKPEINNRYNFPVSIRNGERLLLHCITSGEPLKLTWTLPSGVVLNRPQRAGRYAILPNGTLAIQQVSVYDRGSYVCRASNVYGSSLLSVSVIVIAYPPQITKGPPAVTYARRGVAVQLNCIATGIPQVDVAWETPDKTRLAVSAQPRLFGNKYLHPQGSLIIQNPTQRDTGVYRCTARNAIGMDSKATFLNVF